MKTTTYHIDTQTKSYSYQTGDIFKKLGKVYIHIVNRQQVNTYSERTFNQALFNSSIMTLIDNYPITYKVESKKAKDPLIELLDNNPPTATEETPVLTKREQEFAWQADWDAEKRMQNEQNTFHL